MMGKGMYNNKTDAYNIVDNSLALLLHGKNLKKKKILMKK